MRQFMKVGCPHCNGDARKVGKHSEPCISCGGKAYEFETCQEILTKCKDCGRTTYLTTHKYEEAIK